VRCVAVHRAEFGTIDIASSITAARKIQQRRLPRTLGMR
jgi:hypothetical protein